MKIIRDEQNGGLFMIPLLVDWHIRRCNVVGCRNKPTTIIAGDAHWKEATGLGAFGMCEEHFQQSNVPGGCCLKFEADGFDAFATPEEVA